MGMEQQKEEPFITAAEKIFEERIFNAKQLAQIEIMSNLGLSNEQQIAEWANANGNRVDKLVRDPDSHLLDRLENSDTHEAALEELKQKLYH